VYCTVAWFDERLGGIWQKTPNGDRRSEEAARCLHGALNEALHEVSGVFRLCVGIASTKTLAKLANHAAKRGLQYQGCATSRRCRPPPNSRSSARAASVDTSPNYLNWNKPVMLSDITPDNIYQGDLFSAHAYKRYPFWWHIPIEFLWLLNYYYE
jgi:hypothetical protein